MKEIKLKPLFNPASTDLDMKLFNGSTTNILNLVNVKYPKFLELVDLMYANNWHFAKVDMTNDKKQYENDITKEEQEAYDSILSFLVFLDSIQTNNLPNISDYITLPEITYFLARQTWEEALHSRSYAHILSNGVPKEAIERITYLWRTKETLLNRIKYIAEQYEDSRSNRNHTNFIKVLVANYLLEGLYFYNGFIFFHNLASRGLMIGSDTQIRYIQRDENIHCLAFKDILLISQNENPDLWDDDLKEIVYNQFRDAVKWELDFSYEVLGNNILGISKDSIKDYTYYMANKRLKDIGLESIFPKSKNPYKHLDKLAGIDDESSNRTNQFEEKSITYKSPEIFKGWDDF